MPKPKKDQLLLEELGNLASYDEDELAELREKLHGAYAQTERDAATIRGRIKEFNVRLAELDKERADRAKALRAVKHELAQRLRVPSPAAVALATKPKRRAKS